MTSRNGDGLAIHDERNSVGVAAVRSRQAFHRSIVRFVKSLEAHPAYAGRMKPGRSPDELFGLVQAYESLGVHRAGTEGDRLTSDWLTSLLTDVGMKVHTEEVPFERWDSEQVVLVDGRDVECLAVPYESPGAVDTSKVAVVDLDAGLGGDISVIDEPVAAAYAAGFEAVVCATRHPDGLLRGINRPHNTQTSSLPVFLVAGSEIEALRQGPVHLRSSARWVQTTTTNVIATNVIATNDVSTDGGSRHRHMLTTPLTGWFTCAGERGTGIAVLVDLVQRFVDDRRMLVVATGGHELGYIGAYEWLARRHREHGESNESISSVFHIGASVAVDEPSSTGRQLIATRIARTSRDSAGSGLLRSLLAPIGLDLVSGASKWVGEADAWQQLGVPLLSMTGAGREFHTPNDRAELVTSPASLAAVSEVFAEAMLAIEASA